MEAASYSKMLVSIHLLDYSVITCKVTSYVVMRQTCSATCQHDVHPILGLRVLCCSPLAYCQITFICDYIKFSVPHYLVLVEWLQLTTFSNVLNYECTEKIRVCWDITPCSFGSEVPACQRNLPHLLSG
jgi:hypothetical protein